MTTLRLRKLARDMWTARTRMAMMTVAIAVSVVAVGAFLSARAIIGREITRNYLDTHPASATLVVPAGIDQATLDAVRAQPGVLDATARGSVVARIKISEGRWQPLVLFVSGPDDPQRIATVHVEQGSWPPPADGFFLERTALPFFDVKPGDSVLVQTPAGAPTPLTVAGSVHDGGVAPAEQERTGYGYISTAALTHLGEKSTLTELKIVIGDRARPSSDQAAIERTTQQVGAALAARGLRVDSIQVPPPLRHPHQGQMITISFMLLAFGVISLLLSSILVATMLGAMLTAQIRQIGAMKAVGARTGQILGMYLLQTGAIAVAATGLALLPGAALGRLLAAQAARLLNLDLTSTAIPGWVFAIEIAAGVLAPLMIALLPLVRGSRVTVREAIDDHGADPGTAGGTGIERWLGRLRGPSRSQLMALRNMFRRKGRLALTLGLLAIAGSMFLTGFNTATGWTKLVDQGVANRNYDLQVKLNRPEPVDKLTSLVRSVPGVVGAEAWGSQATAVTTPDRIDVAHVYPDDAHGSFTIMAPPADTPLLHLPLKSGRWLQPSDTNAVVLNHLVPVQQAPGIKVGDDITLTVDGRPTTWHVVGIASDFGTQGAAYVTDQAYAKISRAPGQASMIRIVTDRHDPAGRQATLDQVERALAAGGVSIGGAGSINELKAALDGHVAVLSQALIAIALVMGLVGLLGLASTMSTNVIERTREFGVLHTIGATASAVRTIVVVEGVLIGALSIGLALVLSPPLTHLLGDYIGTEAFVQPLPFQFSTPALLLWTVAALAGAAGATTAAARRASRLTVREALTTI
ncbi:FtsX-like permease family protein [Streptomyces sp. NBC_00191]|uniref:ABC transporter permease n=1 Tax=Streptomyces sp. NBC_00191 TaxID=2975674 RepID=UPI00324907FD